jgi:DNA-binding HxlR family transcriptional regulator
MDVTVQVWGATGTGARQMADTYREPPQACQEPGAQGRFVRGVLDRIGDKWSLMIIGGLHRGPLRFGALQAKIGGISQRMLTLNLRQLERDGLISRTVYAEVPPRVEYELTELGHSLLVPVLELVNWAADNAERIEKQREVYDAANAPQRTS